MRRNQRWQQGVQGFVMRNLPLIFFVTFIFITGVVFGALAIRTLDHGSKQELMTHLSTFFNGLADRVNEYQVNFKDTIWVNVKTVLVIWLLGLSIIGMPIIPVIIFLRGFVIGFTVGFLVHELSFKGMVFALVSILPQNLIIVPAVLIAGMTAISFSVILFKSQISKRPINFGYHLLGYSSIMCMVGIALVLASLIEAFITPVFMELAARFLLKK